MFTRLTKSSVVTVALATIFISAWILLAVTAPWAPAVQAQAQGTELEGPQGPPQHIQAIAEKETGPILFDGMVAPGARFVFTGTKDGNKIGPRVLIMLNEVLRTTIRTDCSDPVGPNWVSGDFTVIDGASRDGGALCPIPPGVSCDVCSGAVTRLTLRYNGVLTDTHVQVFDDENAVLFDGIVQPLLSFTFQGLRRGQQMGPSITVHANGQLNATIDTSCGQLVGPGLLAGDFEVMDGASKGGAALCPMPPANLACGMCSGGVTSLTLQYLTYESGEVLARFMPDTADQTIQELIQSLGGTTATYLSAMDLWQIETPLGNEEFLTLGLLDSGLAVFAEPNYRTSASSVPNDPLYSSQYSLPKIHADQAWDIPAGNGNVVVGILDTGVAAGHQDLAGRVLTNNDWDYVNNDSDASDDHGHGTHVAGIVSAVRNNATGIAGVSQASILPVKVLDQYNAGNTLNVANGIRYAADQGADVINLSLGTTVDSSVVKDAVHYAHGQGVVLVAAAGNGATDIPYYPAAYPEVLAVCATNAADGRWSASNYGNHLDLCAPGDKITSTNWTALNPVTSYGVRSGTSMAAPHVSGAAALLLGVNNTLTPIQVGDLLRQTAQDLYTPGWDPYFGAGRLNAYQAVVAAQSLSGPTPTPAVTPTPTVTPAASATPTPGSAVVDQLQSGALTGVNFVPKTAFAAGETVHLRAHVIDSVSRAPLSGAQVSFAVTQLGGATVTMNGMTDAAGYALSSYLPGQAGDFSYAVTAVNLAGYVFYSASSVGPQSFSVAAPTPMPTATWTPTATPTATSMPGYVQRVNAGGAAYVDQQNVTWPADQAWNGAWGYVSGSAKSTTTAVAGTLDDLLYQRWRDGMTEYRYAVPNGTYQVTLRFAEFEVTKATDRQMRITLEGAVVENALSIYGLVGKATALDRSYTVTVNDGQLNVLFAKNGGRKTPVVSAVEVRLSGQPTPIPTPTFTPTPAPNATATPAPTSTPTPAAYTQRVNAGSTASYSGQGIVWPADQAWNGVWGYVNGSAKSTTNAVAGTTDDLLYQRWRDGLSEYRFTVPNGTYQVTLRFAEFEVTKATDRQMRITMEGVVLENALSIYGLVGKATALQRTYSVTVNDGQLNILFAKNGGSRNPVVSALAVCSGTCAGVGVASFEAPAAGQLPNAIYLPLINR